MKALLSLFFVLTSMAHAGTELPGWVNPNCVLGLEMNYINDKHNDVLSTYHKDGLFRLLTRYLNDDKRYYVIILKGDEAPKKLKIDISVDFDFKTQEVSCRSDVTYSNGQTKSIFKKRVQKEEFPTSREAYALCYETIFTSELKNSPVCR